MPQFLLKCICLLGLLALLSVGVRAQDSYTWSHRLANDTSPSLAVGPGGEIILVTAGLLDTLHVRKYAANGNLIWHVERAGAPSSVAPTVATDGSVFVMAEATSPEKSLLHFNVDGQFQSIYTGNFTGYAVNSGNVALVFGGSIASFVKDGAAFKSLPANFAWVSAVASGAMFMISYEIDAQDANYAAIYDGLGAAVWTYTTGTRSASHYNSLQRPAPSGDFFLERYEGGSDFDMLRRVSPTGQFLHNYPLPASFNPQSVAEYSDSGDLFVPLRRVVNWVNTYILRTYHPDGSYVDREGDDGYATWDTSSMKLLVSSQGMVTVDMAENENTGYGPTGRLMFRTIAGQPLFDAAVGGGPALAYPVIRIAQVGASAIFCSQGGSFGNTYVDIGRQDRLPNITSVTASKTTATAYDPIDVTVKVDAQAPAAGLKVLVYAGEGGESKLLTIPAGATEGKVTMSAPDVTSTHNVDFTARYCGLDRGVAKVNVAPYPVKVTNVTVSKSTIVAGNPIQVKVSWTGNAAGKSLLFTPSIPCQYKLPTLTAGMTSATFNVTPLAVTAKKTLSLSFKFHANQTATAVPVSVLPATVVSAAYPPVVMARTWFPLTVALDGWAPAGAKLKVAVAATSKSSVLTTGQPEIVLADKSTLTMKTCFATVRQPTTFTVTFTYGTKKLITKVRVLPW